MSYFRGRAWIVDLTLTAMFIAFLAWARVDFDMIQPWIMITPLVLMLLAIRWVWVGLRD